MDTKRDMDRITPEKYAAAIVSVFPNIAKVQPEEEKQMVNKKTVKTRINGIEKTVEGILEEGSNYIPVRFLEEIGYDVSWEQSTNTVVIESGTDIKLKIDGENKIVSGIFENNTNFIPVRFLEEVGYEVSWDNDTRTVIVSSK